MNPPRARLLPAVVWWLGSGVALLWPGSAERVGPEWLVRFAESGGDKLVHLGIFLVLGLLTGVAAGRERRVARRAMLACLLWAVATEAIQAVVPHRTPEVLDVVADAAGVAVGFLLAGWRPGRAA